MKLQEQLENITFDDVLLIPQFSNIESRADVQTDTEIMGTTIRTPILSANMDTVTESDMANKMFELGGRGVLHRFQTIEDNVKMFKNSPSSTWCSFGIGAQEFVRVETLRSYGCNNFILDVAHGASKVVADQYIAVKKIFPTVNITVGNFATSDSVKDFVKYVVKAGVSVPNAFKVGIGGGSVCTTRVVTGVGVPQLTALIDCVSTGYPIIADGGIRNSGDYAKAMACGVKAVMVGSMLSGTDETPGDRIYYDGSDWVNRKKDPANPSWGGIFDNLPSYKKYRGSASAESYEAQGKTADHRSAEGESTLVPYKGPVENIIKQMQAGLKSSMSYIGAKDLTEFKERAIMIRVSGNTQTENKAHGKI